MLSKAVLSVLREKVAAKAIFPTVTSCARRNFVQPTSIDRASVLDMAHVPEEVITPNPSKLLQYAQWSFWGASG